jgi:hypothetical protein
MNLTDIARARLINHQIERTTFKTVKDIVGWMGGMQAQDYAMAKWAIGVRLADSIDQEVEAAVNQGEIIRTHVLRPTWHFVSADDVYWMLELTAPQIKASQRSRHKQLGLTETIITKSNTILANALTGRKDLTREELLAELGKAKISLNENRASHLLVQAELDGIVCSGITKRGKQTYTLLEERVPKPKSLTRDEALAKLAGKYFASHGPATLQDFGWWSGLSMNEAKRGLGMVSPDLLSETIDSRTYWFNDFSPSPRIYPEIVHLLPAYDEFLISYENRSASLPYEDFNKTVSINGIFRPIILVNGQVAGIWKRVIKKDRVIIEMELFKQTEKAIKSLIEVASKKYGYFLDRSIEISYK